MESPRVPLGGQWGLWVQMRTQQVCVEWNKGWSGAHPAASGGEWVVFQDYPTLQPSNHFGMGRLCPTAPDTGPAPGRWGGGGAFRSLVDWHSAEKHPHGGTREMLPASCWSKRRGSELGPTGHMGLHRLRPSSGVRAVQGWPYQPVVTVWLQPLWPHAPSVMPTASVNGD